ncbi:MAG: Hsp70 family protein [Desulfobacterium sp.]|jgi:molecular chaperone DnaK|nr:Hsp70 family protein [Desulfobacterium sp.]
MSKSIGIDLGTTNSAAAIKRVHVEMIKNSEGDVITPSCVTVKTKKMLGLIKRDEFVVGKHALEWIKQNPANTVTAVKRLMGRSFSNPEVQKIISDPRQFKNITCQSKGTENSLVIVLNEREYTPEAISAKILEKIHGDAQVFLKDSVEYAVITVPAYFNDKQKHATRTAAALAGMKVQRLLPEPTAAAISFGVDEVKGDEAKTIMVFDFGGGTFDLSVLTISGGQFIEQGKGGNMWLGGEDLDRKIEDFVLEQTAKECDIQDMEGLINAQEPGMKNRFFGELKAAVEQAKIILSDRDEAYIELLGLLKDQDGDLVDVDVTLTRDEFEKMIQPMVQNVIELTDKLLGDIHFTPDLIDNVLLVGGSSKIPCIIRAVKKKFGKDKVLLHERPMLAIAEGAAILSHRLSDSYECINCGGTVAQSDTICNQCGFDLEGQTIDQGVFDIVHSAAHDYYVVLENGERYLFIEKNTPLPCEQTEVFKLVDSDQQLVHMKFFNIVNDEEESIGDFWLGIDDEFMNDYYEKHSDDNDPHTLSIDVTLKIDENNLVEVAVSLKELPGVELSKTLSRGKADEKLFMALEEMIDEANAKEYSIYTIEDLTERIVSVIKDTHKVIDKTTDTVIEPVYNLVKMKMDKARQLAEEEINCYAFLYYAESVLRDFPKALSSKEQSTLRKKIEHLREMNERGTYEENVRAFKDLANFFNEFPLLSILMRISKAAALCDEKEPAMASRFHSAIANLLFAADKENERGVTAALEGIMPEVARILGQYDNETGTIQKGITR